jgi:purine catabolism regulator
MTDLVSVTRIGITVEEAMGLPSLAHARVIAGRAGLGRSIRSVNVMEVPDIARWVREDELLVTTAYPLRDDADALVRLVPMLAERRLAALALKPGRYILEPPAAMLAGADDRGFPLIELPSDASFNDILSDVLGSILNRHALELERSRAIHDRLTSVVLAGHSLPELVTTLAALVGGPALIADGQGRILASSGKAPTGGARLSRPIQVGSTTHGEVAAWVDDERRTDAVLAVEHAATVAALLIAQSRAMAAREQRYRLVFLNELVSGHPLDRDHVLERAGALGWDLSVPRAAAVLNVEPVEGSEEVRVAGQPLEEQLSEATRRVLGRQAIVWGLRNGLAILAEATAPERLVERAERIRSALARSHKLAVSVGIGRVSPDPLQLHRSYTEALQALALGKRLRTTGFVVRHEELGIYRLLSELPSEEALRRYRTEMLGPLLDYDRRRGGSLVRTLECYLRNDRNAAATARELYVAYNTLRYRLQQIDRLIGALDRHGTNRLSVEVALHVHKMLGDGPKTSSNGA